MCHVTLIPRHLNSSSIAAFSLICDSFIHLPSLKKNTKFKLNNETAFSRTSKTWSLVLMGLYVQTINLSKTKDQHSDRYSVSSMLVNTFLHILRRHWLSIFCHSFDKLAFCGVSVKGQTQMIFSFHSCSVFLCYCEMDAFFMFSVFSIPFVGLEAYWVHWSLYHFSCV